MIHDKILGWSNPLIDGELTLMEIYVALKQMKKKANHQVLMVQQQNLFFLYNRINIEKIQYTKSDQSRKHI